MKRVVFTIFAVLILGALIIHLTIAQGAKEKSEKAMEQTILSLLTDEVFAAVRNYYGEPRQYWNDKLLSVNQISEYPACFEVVLQVETFYGPHNPPYGIETITFHIQYDGVEFIHFEHQDN